jgi:hypothetical protein
LFATRQRKRKIAYGEEDGRGEVEKEEGMIEEGGRRRKGEGRSRGRIVGRETADTCKRER